MISVVMAYHNRRRQLFHTLTTMSASNYQNYEIVIVDDFSNEENNIDTIKDIFPNLNINLIKMQDEVDEKWYRNPCVPYNVGFIKSKGDKIIVQNPECCHMGDIISYTAENLNNEIYLSFHCYATGVEETELIRTNKNIVYHEKTIKQGKDDNSKWYNHATYRPASYHFCTALTRENLIKLNGFDEKYALGHSYDDDDFVYRVRRLKLKIEFVDTPFVIHQYHGIEVSSVVTEALQDNLAIWRETKRQPHARADNTINIPDCIDWWKLKNIPKIAHFYWGNEKLSYIRYMSLYSFAKLNPDWRIKLHVPAVLSINEIRWKSNEQKDSLIVKDYFDQLADLNIEIITHDFTDSIGNNAHEVHKSDFLRWEILYKEGGLWSDIDIIYNNPMSNLKENTDSNAVTDTILCPYQDNAHTVGFMLSSKDNDFFRHIHELAKTCYTPKKYQSIGACLLNDNFDSKRKIDEQFSKLSSMYIDEKCVYALNVERIPDFYIDMNTELENIINDSEVIGLHWYAGHPLSQAFESKFDVENLDSYNNILSIAIKKLKEA